MTRHDRTGLVLVLLLAAWAAATGLPRAPASTASFLLLLGGAGTVHVLTRRAVRDERLRVAVPLLLGVGVVGTAALTPGALGGSATAPPLGYGNANGALLVLAVGAALVAAASAPTPQTRDKCLLLAPVAAALTAATGSRAATALAVLVLLLGAAVLLRPKRWTLLVASSVALLLPAATAAGTVVVAVARARGPEAETARPDRMDLWAQAVTLVRSEPWVGAAPGGFARLAPAADDPDLRWAHSLPLQVAAELGAVGAVLLLLLLAWTLRGQRPHSASTVIGTVVLGALLTQAAIDYTAHVPALVLLTIVVVSAAWPVQAPDAD